MLRIFVILTVLALASARPQDVAEAENEKAEGGEDVTARYGEIQLKL